MPTWITLEHLSFEYFNMGCTLTGILGRILEVDTIAIPWLTKDSALPWINPLDGLPNQKQPLLQNLVEVIVEYNSPTIKCKICTNLSPSTPNYPSRPNPPITPPPLQHIVVLVSSTTPATLPTTSLSLYNNFLSNAGKLPSQSILFSSQMFAAPSLTSTFFHSHFNHRNQNNPYKNTHEIPFSPLAYSSDSMNLTMWDIES